MTSNDDDDDEVKRKENPPPAPAGPRRPPPPRAPHNQFEKVSLNRMSERLNSLSPDWEKGKDDDDKGKGCSMVEHDKEDQKKRLKRQLKFDRRVNTLQARIRHSVARGDPIVERQARLELEELVSTRLST
ncbi:hypothetical protein THAOC_27732, partial [Thalassiosira oceanica]